jgi:NDP-mannose synthase
VSESAAVGLIMAGGRSSRMRGSGVTVPKPLVAVGGVPLLERNLRAHVRAGITDVAISVSDQVPEVGAYVVDRLLPIARAAGARLQVLRETAPLGNIGAVRLLDPAGRPVVVTYADNLTTLDLRRIWSHHVAEEAMLTLATHQEPFQLPYGELVLDGGEVAEYVEKPTWRPWVASAVCVLAPAALDLLPEGRPSGLVDLFHAVKAARGRVAAFPHAEPWVDVNDAAALARAEELVRENREAFGDPVEPPAGGTG